MVSGPRGPAIRTYLRAELAKFIELGHLQSNDLLWREGFPDWRPAMVVFPPRTNTPTRPAAQSRTRGDPQQAREHSPSDRLEAHPAGEAPAGGADAADETDTQPQRGRGARVAMLLLIVTALGAVGWFAYPYRDRLKELIGSMSSIATSRCLRDRRSQELEVPPLSGFSDSPETTDAKLQAAALCASSRDFPD